MPLSLKAFTQLRRGLPEDATSEQILAAAKAHEEGTPLEQVWKAVNRPLVGSEDSFFLQHKHADDEGTPRRIAEDLGSSLTAPINVATIAAGGLGSVAGKRAAFGVSNAARGVEAALQAPFIVEGANMALDGDTTGEQLGGAAMAGLGAFGVRQAAKHSFRPKDVRDAFAKTKGLTLDDAPVTPRSDADGMRAADAYAEMPHTPNDPKVASAYKAMSADVEQQYDFLVNKAGVKIEPWTSEGQPYKNSAEMVADVEKNNHLWFFPSESGFGDGAIVDNPLLNKGTNQVVINDMFRAVHDYFGHAVKRNQFGPQGEEIAWREHAKLFNRPGRDAMTSETRGQNSWVNYGPHMRDADGSLLPKGQQPHPSERPYGDQKTGLLAEEFQLTPEERAIAASAPGQSAPAPSAASLDVPSQTPVGSVDAGRIAPNSGVVGTSAELSGSPLILSDELAEQIKANHLQDNGSSTSILNQKTHTPEDGRFMVSPYVGRELALDAPPTAEDLHKFVEVNQDLLNKPGHFLGSWFNKGDKKHYLDVSVGENDLNKTLTLARDSKQMAIFDTKAGREFPTGQYREAADRPGLWERMQSEVGEVKFGGSQNAGSGTPLALAGPVIAGSGELFDDSDPNAPDYEFNHSMKVGLRLLGLASTGAVGATVLKQIKSPVTLANTLATGQRALGKSEKQIAVFLRANVPDVKDSTVLSALKFSKKRWEKLLVETGGKFNDLKHLRRLVKEGAEGKKWYAEGPMLKQVLKDAGTVATPEEERVWEGILGAMGSQNPPKGNYRDARALFEAYKDGVLKIRKNGTLAPPAAWHPKTPGLNNVANILKNLELSGRKINSYGGTLAGKANSGLVADRWHARGHGFPKDSRAGLGDIKNPIYEAMEQLAPSYTPEGWTVEEAQAALWRGIRLRDADAVLATQGPEAWKKPQQGYGMLQQHRLYEAEEQLVNANLVERVFTPAPTAQNKHAIEESLELTAKGKKDIAVPLKQFNQELAAKGAALLTPSKGLVIQLFPERGLRIPKGVEVKQGMLESFYFDNADLLASPNVTVSAIKNPKGGHQLSIVAVVPDGPGARELATSSGVAAFGPTSTEAIAGTGRNIADGPHLYDRLKKLDELAQPSLPQTGTDDIPF